MKNYTAACLLVAAGAVPGSLGLVSMMQPPAQEQGARVAVVDMGEIVKRSQFYARIKQSIQGQQNKWNEELRVLAEKRAKLKEEENLLNDGTWQKREVEIQIKNIEVELEGRRSFYRRKLEEEGARAVLAVARRVEDRVTKFANGKFDIVLKKPGREDLGDSQNTLVDQLRQMGRQRILYNSARVDITQQILQLVDAGK